MTSLASDGNKQPNEGSAKSPQNLPPIKQNNNDNN